LGQIARMGLAMKNPFPILATIFGVFLFAVFMPMAAKAGPGTIALEPAFSAERFQQPLGFETAPGGDAFYIVEQGGKVFRLTQQNGTHKRELFLDITNRVISGGERGLLGLTFHPKFPARSEFFVHYSELPTGATIIARYRTTAAGLGDPASEERLLRVPQPYSNHNGGQIRFGPDGYLYIALGDGGSAGDPQGNGQKLNTLLGKILRIDPHNPQKGESYRIPADNPFPGKDNRPEIYAYGLRNPWRFSFDRASGALWAPDVGQNAYEEINRITKGGNYGWNHLEGNACYKPRTNCGPERFIAPLHTYPHTEGASITGGFVYRGNAIPVIEGRYIYGDFVSGKIWALSLDGKRNELLLDTEHNISSFGEDAAGELYLLSYRAGKVYQMVKG